MIGSAAWNVPTSAAIIGEPRLQGRIEMRQRRLQMHFAHPSGYVDAGQDYYERQYHDRVVRNLTRRAKELGFALTPEPPETVVT